VLLHTRILRHRKLALNKSDVTWNINLNTPARSLKGILLLFEDPAVGAMWPAFGRNSEFYYNPLITKVQVTAEGIPNQLYAQGMLPYQHWDEIVKEFAREDLKSAKLPSTDISTYCGSISGAATTANCTGRAAGWRTHRRGLRSSSIRLSK